MRSYYMGGQAIGVGYYETILHGGGQSVAVQVTMRPYYMGGGGGGGGGGQSVAVQVTMRPYYMGGQSIAV